MPFNSLGLHADLVRAVKDLGFTQPTPIQRDAIPAAVAKRDVLASSATGSGKTAAFVLPILNRLLGSESNRTRALIVTPTRELAEQIHQDLIALSRHTKIKGAAVYGGVGMGPQRRAFEHRTPIIVATPGRLLDHLQYRYADLSGVEVLVLDEADRMLDMGFLPDIRRIMNFLPKQRQTLFFSATMPPEVAGLTRELLKDPAKINIERQRTVAGVEQSLYPVPQQLKAPLLLNLIKGGSIRNALVFTRTKRRADRLADFLERNGLAATRIHGDRSQSQRIAALEGFKNGRYKILVATDVAARGIHVEALSHVINYDLPQSPDDYVHRVGRTARAEMTGNAFSFVAPEDEGEVKLIERAIAIKINRVKVEDFDYRQQVPAHTGGGGGGGHRHNGGNGGGGNGQGRSRSHRHSDTRPWLRGGKRPAHSRAN